MMRMVIAVAGMLLTACAELPEPDAPLPDVVHTPSWADRAPTAADILRVYPQQAMRAGVGGLAYLTCTVLETRRLACSVSSEDPVGYEFGKAALDVADLFLTKQGVDVVAPGKRVRIPVRFVLE